MRVQFRITRALLDAVRQDLLRPHAFAWERVGFIAAGFAMAGSSDVIALAQSYRPVADEDYLRADDVGAMMGPPAIRKAMQWALTDRVGLFHVHSHAGRGLPHFSEIDLSEQAKFMPSFFHVAASRLHGALVLSNDAARGRVWLSSSGKQTVVDEFVEVGAPLRIWRGHESI